MTSPIRSILLDIEGTTTPIAFVKDVLFPFASSRGVPSSPSTAIAPGSPVFGVMG